MECNPDKKQFKDLPFAIDDTKDLPFTIDDTKDVPFTIVDTCKNGMERSEEIKGPEDRYHA